MDELQGLSAVGLQRRRLSEEIFEMCDGKSVLIDANVTAETQLMKTVTRTAAKRTIMNVLMKIMTMTKGTTLR